MKVLVVIDMQNDFIDGALGTAEAQAIVPGVREKIRTARQAQVPVVFTRDTHGADYLQTQEGRKLPVPHCVKNTFGWQIESSLDVADSPVFDKPGFGSTALVGYLASLEDLTEVELIGLCTDICVLTNAFAVKTALPEVQITVDAACCAGVTPQSHRTALDAMRCCQIEIL